MYSIEIAAPPGARPTWFDTAEEAMTTVNRLRALQIRGFVIRDKDGAILNERQLAMVVMESRLLVPRQVPERF